MTKERLQRYTQSKAEIAQIGRLLGGAEFPALRAEYAAQRAALEEEQLCIERAVATLPPNLRILLRYRYLCGMRWEEVCEVCAYSWRQAHRLHGQALRMLAGSEEEAYGITG